MDATAKLPSRLESASIAGSAAAVGALLLLAGLIPHKERALLLTDGQLQAKAFAAVVAPLDAQQAQRENALLHNLGHHAARLAGKPAHSASPGLASPTRVLFADAAPPGFPNPAADDPAFAAPPGRVPGAAPGSGVPFGDSSSSGGIGAPGPFNPIGAAPNISPANQASTSSSSSGGAGPNGTTSGGTTSGGTTSGGTSSGGTTSGGAAPGSTTSGGTPPNGNPTQTSAVPEPATWLTMICGFFLLGSAIRRQRKLHTITASMTN